MMDESEIASLWRQLLSETRTYCGAQFPCCCGGGGEEIAFYKGLLQALPSGERVVVEASFNRIYSAVAMHRVAAHHATHRAPEAMQ